MRVSSTHPADLRIRQTDELLAEPGRLATASLVSFLLALAPACGPGEEAPPSDASGGVVTSTGSAVAPAGTPRPWRHLSLSDLDLDLGRFRAIRARYLQVMYDMEGRGEAQYHGIVDLDLDTVVHSGPYVAEAPERITPLREPGLRIVWQVQNALYSAFDRVLTDSRLSILQRVMPSGTVDLRVGTVVGDEHRLLVTDLAEGQTSVPVTIAPLPDGALNVLTLPYALAAMDLVPGDRFVLPGFAMFGGPDGGGIPWKGAMEVVSTGERSVEGRSLPVAEVLYVRMDERNGLTAETVDFEEVGRRVTRLLISPEPPYLLGRADLMTTEAGSRVLVRESLGLVDWAEQPLPTSDLAAAAMWHLDLAGDGWTLASERIPEVLVPLQP